MALAIEQAEVHPPGVDADGVKPAFGQSQGNAFFDLKHHADNIPVKHAVKHHGIVAETMDFLCF